MYTYIVVDDEEITRKGTIAKLRRISDQAVCVGEADNGTLALELIEQLNPDIIITDMNMPVMDGTVLLPIIAEKYPEKPLIVISGYNSFDYTRHAIRAKAVDYLVKPFGKEELITAFQSAVASLNSQNSIRAKLGDNDREKERICLEYDIQQLTNVLLGFHEDTIVFSSKKLSNIDTGGNFILMTIYSNHEAEYSERIELEASRFNLNGIFFRQKNTKSLEHLILFFPESASATNRAENAAAKLAEIICRLYPDDTSVGISKVHGAMTSLHKAYMESASALSQRKINEHSVHRYSDLCGENTMLSSIVWDKEEELLFRVETGMEKEVYGLVNELFDYLATLSDRTYSDIQVYCYRLLEESRAMLSNYVKQISSSASSSYKNLDLMFSLSELRDYMQRFLVNIARFMTEEGIYQTDDIIAKIQLYVQKNYYKNLTVELMACFFYLNRSYLSHYYKEKTGIKFTEYLTGIRIGKAKEMLQNSDKKIAQISKSVGYDNVKYFFKVFKKQTGMSPEEYRSVCQ